MDIQLYQGNGFINPITDREKKKLIDSKILIAGRNNQSKEVIKILCSLGLKKPVEIEAENFKSLQDVIKNSDVIIDCFQKLEQKFLLNDFAIKYRKPFVYANITGSYAQATTIVPEKTPCLKCLFTKYDDEELTTEKTAENIIKQTAKIEVTEAINLLLEKGTGLKNCLLTFCEDDENYTTIKLSQNIHCDLCSKA